MSTSHRVMWSREMTAEQQRAFFAWADEQYEWGERIWDARHRDAAEEQATRERVLREASEYTPVTGVRSIGSEERTVVERRRVA